MKNFCSIQKFVKELYGVRQRVILYHTENILKHIATSSEKILWILMSQWLEPGYFKRISRPSTIKITYNFQTKPCKQWLHSHYSLNIDSYHFQILATTTWNRCSSAFCVQNCKLTFERNWQISFRPPCRHISRQFLQDTTKKESNYREDLGDWVTNFFDIHSNVFGSFFSMS